MRRPTFRLSAAVTLLIATFWLLGPGQQRQAIAFPNLLEAFMDAKSARFQMEVKVDKQPPQKFKAYFRAPASMRQELGNVVNISDFQAGKIVSLDPARKEAIIMTLKNRPKDQQSGNFFVDIRRQLRDLKDKPDEHTEELPERALDGHRVVGLRTRLPAMALTFWGDVSTGRLVRLEGVMSLPIRTEVLMKDFEFDVPLDEALFSLVPPKGYQVRSMEVDASEATEKDFVDSLRTIVDLHGGTFPDTVHPTAVILALMKTMKFTKENPPKDEEIQKLMQASIQLGRGLQWAYKLTKASEARYAGKGVTLNAKGTPVFWYKPAGQEKWRVLDAELTFREEVKPPQVEGATPLTTDDDEGPAQKP